MKKFLARIYNTTALSICGAVGAAYVGMSFPQLMTYPLATVIFGGLTTAELFRKAMEIDPKVVAENQPGVPGPVYKT